MAKQESYICLTCGATSTLVGDGFCDQCGSQLVQARYCDECGVMAAHAGEFCRECGASLPPLLPAVAAAPQAAPPPAKAEPKPAWLTEPEPDPQPIRRVPRQRQPKAEPTPQRYSPAPSQPASAPQTSLVRRPQAAPVPMRAAPLAPSATGNAALVASGVAGLLGLAAMAGSLPLALFFFVVMLVIGGRRLGHAAADAVGRVVDWIWEDPVLRRRFLGE